MALVLWQAYQQPSGQPLAIPANCYPSLATAMRNHFYPCDACRIVYTCSHFQTIVQVIKRQPCMAFPSRLQQPAIASSFRTVMQVTNKWHNRDVIQKIRVPLLMMVSELVRRVECHKSFWGSWGLQCYRGDLVSDRFTVGLGF